MKRIPFGHTPDTELFYQSTTHTEALNVLTFSLNSGEAFCKIIGEVGCGKTMLCRILIRKLENSRQLAYIPNPNLSVRSLHFALAKELGLRIDSQSRDDQIIQSIQNRLIKINQKKGPVVLIIDEAQVMSEEALEAIRLFTNLETEQQKLLQIVLFAQPELDKKLAKQKLRQLNQRISFSYHLKKLTPPQVIKYIEFRLKQVSIRQVITCRYISGLLVYYFSKGTPRLINTLCHKALLLGYAKNQPAITASNIFKAALDTDGVDRFLLRHFKIILTLTLIGISGSAFAYLGAA